MEGSPPPQDVIVTGIGVVGIIPGKNDIVNGSIPHESWGIKFTPLQVSANSGLLIEVEFKWRIDNTRYVDHTSKTLFLIAGLSLDYLQPADPRIETISELGLSAVAHSRALFSEYTLNSVETVVLPTMLFMRDIRKEVITQLVKTTY